MLSIKRLAATGQWEWPQSLCYQAVVQGARAPRTRRLRRQSRLLRQGLFDIGGDAAVLRLGHTGVAVDELAVAPDQVFVEVPAWGTAAGFDQLGKQRVDFFTADYGSLKKISKLEMS